MKHFFCLLTLAAVLVFCSCSSKPNGIVSETNYIFDGLFLLPHTYEYQYYEDTICPAMKKLGAEDIHTRLLENESILEISATPGFTYQAVTWNFAYIYWDENSSATRVRVFHKAQDEESARTTYQQLNTAFDSLYGEKAHVDEQYGAAPGMYSDWLVTVKIGEQEDGGCMRIAPVVVEVGYWVSGNQWMCTVDYYQPNFSD